MTLTLNFIVPMLAIDAWVLKSVSLILKVILPGSMSYSKRS